MIKPPFTLLILKDSHNPVTIRVTFGFLITLFLIPAVCLIIGYIAAAYVNIPVIAELHNLLPDRDTSVMRNHIGYPQEAISIDSDDNLTISYTPVVPDLEQPFYFWIIVNHDSQDAGRRRIYPRNPINRGFPVDYRNGIPYPENGGELTIRLRKEIGNIDIDDVRILAYTDTGELILDRSYSPSGENTR